MFEPEIKPTCKFKELREKKEKLLLLLILKEMQRLLIRFDLKNPLEAFILYLIRKAIIKRV